MTERTRFPDQVSRSHPLDVDDQDCLIDWQGNWRCSHAHLIVEPELQDQYEQVPGWTAQSVAR
jgi:hypothetical protein